MRSTSSKFRKVFNVDKPEHRNFKFLNFPGNSPREHCKNDVSMLSIDTKYQWNRNAKSMFNHAPKFAQCETRSKFD